MAFVYSKEQGTTLWTGDPDSQAAHDDILQWIRDTGQPFLPPGSSPTPRITGNIGELTAFRIGRGYVFTDAAILAHAANADQPLSDISRPYVDMVWLYFGERPRDDWACLQEVKATGNPSLEYAKQVIDDYAKLFATDPRFTLRTRLDALKNRLELQWNRPDLAKRLTTIGGSMPSTVTKVHILPTVVHERRNASPIPKMLVVRESLIGQGWADELIDCWSIALDDFTARVSRLIVGT